MKLRELTAPFERKKVVTYKADRTTAFVKGIELQPVCGTLYRDATTYDDGHRGRCSLYAYFDCVGLGIYLNALYNSDERDLDEIQGLGEQMPISSLEAYTIDLVHRAKSQEFISHAELEFARLAIPDRFPDFQSARRVFDETWAQRQAEKRAKRKAEEAAFCKEKNNAAQESVDQAIELIRNGGILKNTRIVFYKSRYNCSSYSIINYIARMYSVPIPLKVQGWINSSLFKVTIQDGTVRSYTCSSHSRTFKQYMDRVVQAVRGGAGA